MKIRAALMGGICASAIAFPAYAQDTDEDEITADEDVIIVTATLRASDIQEVPIAVTAVQPAELQRQGIQDIKSLSSVSPSFNIQSSQTETQGTSIRIRGVGTTGNNTGLESSVGVFIDGVYQSRPGIALGDLLDLERLEILRGPQGTLFGRNTSAGALNITTKRPDLNEVEGFANATYGNLGYYGAQAGVSVPVIQDELGVRFSGAYRKRDGYIVSSTSGAESGNRDRFILRGQMLWEPTADMSLRLIGDYAESDENCCTAVIIRETPYRDLGAFEAYGLPANGGVIDYGFDAVENRLSSDDGYINTTKQWGVSGQLDYNLGGAELTYIGSFRHFESQSAQDDFVGVDVYQVGPSSFAPNAPFSGGDNEVMTHELRLKGTFGDGAVDWLVGAYYSDEQIDEIQSMVLGPDYQAYASNALFPLLGNNFATFGPNPLFALTRLAQATGFTVIPGLGAVPNAALPSVVGVDASGSFAVNRFTQDAQSFSVFTHNVISFTDELSLTLGARYVDETKDGAFNQVDASSPACATIANGFGNIVQNLVDFGQSEAIATAVASAGLGLTCFPFTTQANLPASAVLPLPREYDLTFEDDELTYTAQLAYNVGDFLGYASFSHGFKSGGFNLDPAASAGGADPRFDSEKVDAYEIGIKTSLANRQITANLALFHMEMTDFQVLEFTGVQFQTFNVAAAKSTGAELELVGRFDPYMTINLSGTYANARYADDCDEGITGSALATVRVLCGQPLTNAPKFSGVAGITYDGPINSSGWGMLANLNVYYSGDRRTSTTPTETAPPFTPLPLDYQEAYFKINARLGFTTPNERFTLEFWGLNLSNEITRGITANTPLRGGAGNRSRIAFLEEPRTYGVTVRTKF
ncbi:TonB-dependent receptor [Qipengyuania sphaerica]|uniref:TonB-dependent receptor n=1 Tax=Qipengyuania sphaerica TaxID=2867243 RepID=UPI001C88A907|nr:TonB-dependent receptor [Qipengyuania sphaerica]MBX7541201.1 TonB-dependent receptor [Qipengyuania sphaerica]